MADEKISVLVTLKDNASKGLKKLGGGLKTFAGKAAGIAKVGLLGFAAATAAAGTAAVKTAAQLEQERQGFITLLGSAEDADAAIEMIKKDAAATPFELPGLIQANKLLTTVTKNASRSEAFLLDIGKALAAAGKGQAELDRVIVNLQQIGSVGKASMMDIKQFAFAGIPIFDLLTEATGKSGEELQNMISTGQISFELLESVFQKAGSEGGQFADAFSNQMGTLSQMTSNLKDNFTIMGTELVKEIGLFDGLKTALGFINANMDGFASTIKNTFAFLKDLLTPAVEAFMAAADFGFLKDVSDQFMGALSEQMPRIKEILEGIASVFGKVFNIVGKIVKILIDAGAINAITVAFKFLVDVLELVLNIISKILDVFGKLINKFKNSKLGKILGKFFELQDATIGNIGDILTGDKSLKEGAASQIGAAQDFFSKINSVNDFIVTKNGQVLETNPNDTIIGTKTPGSLGGGGVNVFIETVQGLDPSQIAASLQSVLSDKVRY